MVRDKAYGVNGADGRFVGIIRADNIQDAEQRLLNLIKRKKEYSGSKIIK